MQRDALALKIVDPWIDWGFYRDSGAVYWERFTAKKIREELCMGIKVGIILQFGYSTLITRRLPWSERINRRILVILGPNGPNIGQHCSMGQEATFEKIFFTLWLEVHDCVCLQVGTCHLVVGICALLGMPVFADALPLIFIECEWDRSLCWKRERWLGDSSALGNWSIYGNTHLLKNNLPSAQFPKNGEMF